MKTILNLFQRRKKEVRLNEEILAIMDVLVADIEFRQLQQLIKGSVD